MTNEAEETWVEKFSRAERPAKERSRAEMTTYTEYRLTPAGAAQAVQKSLEKAIAMGEAMRESGGNRLDQCETDVGVGRVVSSADTQSAERQSSALTSSERPPAPARYYVRYGAYLRDRTMSDIERDMYLAHYSASPQSSVEEIAKAMGIGRATLYRRIAKWEAES